jgi:hypothetical protein
LNLSVRYARVPSDGRKRNQKKKSPKLDFAGADVEFAWTGGPGYGPFVSTGTAVTPLAVRVFPEVVDRTKQTFDRVATFPDVSRAFTRRVIVVALVAGTVHESVPDFAWLDPMMFQLLPPLDE